MYSLLTLSLLATSQLVGVVLARDPLLNITTASSIEWGPCDPSVITNPALSCSFFEIPLDYHDPSIGYGRLALAKLNATQDRLGTVFLNPGMLSCLHQWRLLVHLTLQVALGAQD